MRLARFTTERGCEVFVGRRDGWRPVPGVDAGAPHSIVAQLQEPRRTELAAALEAAPAVGRSDVRLAEARTIHEGGDIWGAGLNYRRHSEDLNTEQPKSGPGSYLRPNGCLIDNGQPIVLPPQSRKVTAESELGLVIGTRCKDVWHGDWTSVVAGVTAVLDMTAEDFIRENPRYIPWAKGFDTFCSIGPQLVTLDEFEESGLESLRVSTVRNGEVIASALVSDMKYNLGYLVEYFSAGRTLRPGTVICTGTPGAAAISRGDVIEAVVEHVGTLTHPVA
ncbi:MAG: hydrolase family protein [Solirubrobacterales bacterium]|nr:hydrolase family protein [Solirubrobacterales bacterium]